jgi:hypothetical protein
MTRSVRRAFVATLALPFAMASVAHAQPDEAGLPRPGERGTAAVTSKGPTDGFLGRRPLLKDLSPADQKLLAGLILQYTTANNSAVVKTHENTMMDPKLHGVHQAPYTLLFSWHRTYIEGLEAFLTSKGHGNFVPLPKWIPSDPIPVVFGQNQAGKKIIKNFNPTVDWTPFIHSKLGVFSEEIRASATDTTPNAKILADTLVVPHNNTHNMIGGTMSTMGSPAAPIFWCYHAFIDDVAWDYEHLPKSKNASTEKATAPEGGVTTVTGQVMVSPDGSVMIMTPAGDFDVTNEPFKGLLAGLDGKKVTLQAKLSGKEATVESVTGMVSGATFNVRDDHGKAIGTRGDMEEVRITGVKGGKLEIDQNGQKGFILKSGVAIASPSATPGMNGAMHGHE